MLDEMTLDMHLFVSLLISVFHMHLIFLFFTEGAGANGRQFSCVCDAHWPTLAGPLTEALVLSLTAH